MSFRQILEMERYVENVGWLRAFWNVASCYVIGWFLQLLCRIFGHDLEDNGYANPDSGAIHVECNRCYQSWHTQLY